MLKSPDFLESSFGNYHSHSLRCRRLGPITDLFFEARLKLNPSYRKLLSKLQQSPIRKILIVGVEVPTREKDLTGVMNALSQTRHDVTLCRAPLEKGKGKFQNINSALASLDVAVYDWLLVTDDDILFEPHFLDKFIYIAESTNIDLCQPAHKFYSYQSFWLTQRHWNSLARVTYFVECGPLTAFRRNIYSDILPFPDLRWAWGTDVAWSEIARDKFKIGIVDATPICHWRAIAKTYDRSLALQECQDFLESIGLSRTKQEILKTVKMISAV